MPGTRTGEQAAGRADGRSRRWAEHRRSRRAAFVDAAIGAVEAGGAEIGVDAVAAHAGVSRTVLYRYFDGRDDLQAAVARRAVELLLVQLVTPLRSSPTPRRMIRGVVRAYLRWLDSHPELYRLVATRSAIGPTGRGAFTEGETLFAAQLSDVLSHYMGLLGIRDASVQPLAVGLVGMVEAAGDWWTRHRGTGRRRLVDQLSDSIWYVVDGHLRARGVRLDPDLPLRALEATPEEET